MKKFILLLFNLLLIINIHAQSVFVRYIMTQSGSESKVWKCDLFLKDAKSSFTCELKESMGRESKGYDPETNTVRSKSNEYDETFSRFDVFIDIKEGNIFNRRVNLFGEKGEYYLVKDKIGLFDWKLTEETKEISTFPCQKAICNFRGRNFTAWFTTKIPISLGPWKFNGLPGLILEVYDDKKEYYFETQAISLPSVIDAKTPSKNSVEIELKEYVKLRELFLKRKNEETLRKLKATLPRGASVSFSSRHVVGIEQEFEFEEEKKNPNVE